MRCRILEIHANELYPEEQALTVLPTSGAVPQTIRGMPGGFGNQQQSQQPSRSVSSRLPNGKMGKSRVLCRPLPACPRCWWRGGHSMAGWRTAAGYRHQVA